MAKGIHLFPFRTEKLSPLAPMVLPTGGRVGRCRIQMERVTEMWLSLFFLSYLSCLVLSYLILSLLVCCVRVVFSFCDVLLWLFSVFCCILCSLLSLLLRSFVFFQPCCGSLLSACLACFCLPDFSLFVYILFLCLCLLDTVCLFAFKPVLLWY